MASTPSSPSPTPLTPTFRTLSEPEAEAIVRQGHIGRLAFASRDRVDIEPLHYVYEDRWIYFRTALGTKVGMLTWNPWVAFEVDEVIALFDWRSVVAKGTVYILSDDETERGRELRARAVDILRRLIPEALREGDPVPDRTILMRMHVDEFHGRAASTRG